MKRLSRLTALLLAIMMLCTMFASAESGTSGGVSVEDWTLSDYQRAVETASEETAGGDMEDPWGLVGECGDDNIYCVYARELIALGTAQERYERMMELGSDPEDETALEFTMLHYFGIGEHNKTGVLCTCNYPAYEPEYVPGDVSLHDAACPWHFANLSAAEQYEVVEPMELEAQLPCFAVLTLRQAADLAVYADTQEEGYLSFPCSDENEYCVEIRTVLANMTATEIYDYLTALYYEGLEEGEEGPSAEYVALMLHYGEYHLAEELVCTCGEHPVLVPETEVGDISLHEETCPWHFANLTAAEQVIIYYGLKADNQKNYFKFLPVEEQYLIIKDLPAEEQTEYTVTLSKAQYDALMAYMDSAAGVNSPDEEVKDEIAVEGTTASITVPQGTFETDYIMNTAPAAMTEAEQTAIDALGDVHVLAAFNISFTDANDSSVKLQPIDGKTVELTFTIDVTAVEGNTIQIYHLADNGDGTYTAEPVGDPVSVDKTQATQTITVQASAFSVYFTGESCDGTACDVNGGATYSYAAFMKETTVMGRYNYLANLYDQALAEESTETNLETFMLHLVDYHADALELICSCSNVDPSREGGFPAPGADHAEDCPWHDVEEQPSAVGMITGNLPEGAVPSMEEIEPKQAMLSALGIDLSDESIALKVFDLKLLKDNAKVQPDETLTVKLNDIYDTSIEDSAVVIFHVLESAEAIQNVDIPIALSSPELLAAYPEAVEAAREAGFNDMIFIEQLNSQKGDIELNADGSIEFAVDSFSVFYVVAGSSSRTDNLYYEISIVELPGERSTYYVEPGTTIQFNSGSFSGNGGNKITRANRTITVAADAEIGATATFTVSNYNVTFIVATRNDVLTGALANHPLYLAIKTDTGIPSEPGFSNGDYSRLDSDYKEYNSWSGAIFSDSSTAYIKADIQNELLASVDGTSTVGVYDATGNKCLEYLQGIDWEKMMDAAVELRAYATNGVRVSSSNRNNYVVIPYVVKLMAEGGIGWHIDCAVVPKNSITLSYDLNLKNYIVSGTLQLPNAVTNNTGSINTSVGYIKRNNSNLNVNSTLTATLNGVQHTVKFLGWSTDPNATEAEYVPGSQINVTEDTVLYAIWSGKADTGTLVITKTVEGEDAPANDEFSFAVTFARQASVTCEITDAQNNVVSRSSLASGGTLKLKAGQTATLTEVPLGSYTVVETPVVNYALTSSSGTTGAIEKDTVSTAAFTNTYSKPTAPLTIRKTVTANTVGGTSAPETDSFAFTVTLSDGNAHSYTVYNANGTATSTTGTITGGGTINLMGGQYAVIEDVTIGSSYTVTENLTAKQDLYYDLTSKTGDSGEIAVNGSEAVFTNTYSTGSLTITKEVWDSTFTDGTKTFTFTVDGPVDRTVEVKVTGTSALTDTKSETISGLPVGSYTVTEIVPNGYTASGNGAEVEVEAGQEKGVTVRNTATGTIAEIPVTKTWIDFDNSWGLRPGSVTINLVGTKPDGSTFNHGKASLTLNSNGGWAGKWTDVPQYDDQGNWITYSITENAVANYSASINGFAVTNTLKTGSLQVTKNNLQNGESAIFKVTVTPTGGTEKTYTIVLNSEDNDAVLVNLPAGASYTVVEDSWSWSYTQSSKSGDAGTIWENGTAQATFSNAKTEQWLYDESSKPNVFTTTKN